MDVTAVVSIVGTIVFVMVVVMAVVLCLKPEWCCCGQKGNMRHNTHPSNGSQRPGNIFGNKNNQGHTTNPSNGGKNNKDKSKHIQQGTEWVSHNKPSNESHDDLTHGHVEHPKKKHESFIKRASHTFAEGAQHAFDGAKNAVESISHGKNSHHDDGGHQEQQEQQQYQQPQNFPHQQNRQPHYQPQPHEQQQQPAQQQQYQQPQQPAQQPQYQQQPQPAAPAFGPKHSPPSENHPFFGKGPRHQPHMGAQPLQPMQPQCNPMYTADQQLQIQSAHQALYGLRG
jgi:hypothetical protein